jgi:hypothetical protein
MPTLAMNAPHQSGVLHQSVSLDKTDFVSSEATGRAVLSRASRSVKSDEGGSQPSQHPSGGQSPEECLRTPLRADVPRALNRNRAFSLGFKQKFSL